MNGVTRRGEGRRIPDDLFPTFGTPRASSKPVRDRGPVRSGSPILFYRSTLTSTWKTPAKSEGAVLKTPSLSCSTPILPITEL